MPNRIRIIEYHCWNGHTCTASWIKSPVNPKYAEVSAFCEVCGPCSMAVSLKDVRAIKPIAEFVCPCDGLLLCLKENNYDDCIYVSIDEEFSWMIGRLNKAILKWRNFAVYSIVAHDKDAPREVKAAWAAMKMAC